MRVQIYQINSERDKERQKFMNLKDGENPDPSIYDEVFDAEIDETDLESIYARFNTDRHPLFRGHSLSVSDVVVMDGKASICQNVGFREVPFDVSQTQKPDNLMRVVYVEPNKPPYVAEIENTLEGKQRAVQGYIEPVYIENDGTCLIGNEEAKLIGMEGNRRIGNSIYAGPLYVTRDNGVGGLCSLTDEQVQKYSEMFAEPHDISPEETQGDVGFVLFGW